MSDTVCISKEEYDFLLSKSQLFDRYVESGELNPAEIKQIENALKGPFLSKSEFLKRHPGLA
ncbi:MAG: hypothetical protein AABX47_02205 [Nanoarchaeota archaeon]